MKLLNIKTSYSLGFLAENQACKYLKVEGYKIVKKNYKTHLGEIDILAEKNNTLVAVEVKYRGDEESLPYVILPKQMERIQNALLLFQQANENYNNHYLRFDAILISKNNLNHIENAWEGIY